jgi:anhydro-N-acetylmuramic acid kinase
MNSHYVGLMSGTSMDAIDAVLIRIDGNENLEVVAALTSPFPANIPVRLRELISEHAPSMHEVCTLDTQLGEIYADAVLELLAKSNVRTDRVRAIGSHGQTLFHRPDNKHPYSLQIGNPSLIAEKTGITTVADFRSRDLAAGGQGAPLVPAFHKAIFSSQDNARVIVNIGGIANITLLPKIKDKLPVYGYDTGPGNCLLDTWSRSCRGKSYDANGDWAATGNIDQEMLDSLIVDHYFSKSPPKSTGIEEFNLEWLERTYPLVNGLPAEDVQATLTELTAHTIALAILREGYDNDEIFICGGGVHNSLLMERVEHHLPAATISSTAAIGMDPDYVEATAFAWLAMRTMEKRPGNLPAVTGAQHPVILGAIYQS